MDNHADAQRDLFAERIFNGTIAFMEMISVYLGDQLGYYAAMADGKPLTAAELSSLTSTDARYTREWLEQQAVGAILDVESTDDPEARRYTLPAGHREALCDRDSLAFVAPLSQQMIACVRPIDALVEAYKTGSGVPFESYGEDMRQGIERGNRPQFLNCLASDWIPAMPDIEQRLRSNPPANVADFGCGSGWSSIAIALGFPNALVHGLDIDESSIRAARLNAADQGLGDRLKFSQQDASDASLTGRYDLACAFECIHDMADPISALRAMRNLVGEGGTVLIADERVADIFSAPGDELERFMYGFSVVHCLPVGLVDQPSSATGTVMRKSTFEGYAKEAGFASVEVLAVENDFWYLYRLTA